MKVKDLFSVLCVKEVYITHCGSKGFEYYYLITYNDVLLFLKKHGDKTVRTVFPIWEQYVVKIITE